MRYILIILVFLSVGANAQMVIKAHANYRPFAQPAANLLLDDYPNAAAAYSLRKLDKDYTGAAIRVRKDTTGQPEQDIGFTASGDLDTASLKSFVGSNNGLVVSWYDQSGNGRTATQSTAGRQPSIIGAGVILRNPVNNKIIIQFNYSVNQSLVTSNQTFAGDVTMFGTYNMYRVPNLTTEFSYGIFSYGEEANAKRRSIIIWNGGSGNTWYHYASGFAQNVQIAQATVPVNSLVYSLFNNTSQQISGGYNGATAVTASRTLTNPAASPIRIGATGSENSNSNIFEVILYNSNQSSNRTGIENNINDYYNLYWNGDFTGLLDTYGSSAAAYSLRNLSSTYTGPLIRVRKDTTGQPEMDIYGDYYGNLDTVGLKNFLLTRSGFVTTWYDQSGNSGRNATQTTQANQPRIALNGVIDRVNTKPAVVYDGSNDNLGISGFATNQNISLLQVGRRAASSYSVSFNASCVSGGGYNFIYNTDICFVYTRAGSTFYKCATESSTSQILTHAYSDGNLQIWKNNTQYSLGSEVSFSPPCTLWNNIGQYAGGSIMGKGEIQEVILYLSYRISDRAGLSNNINTHYGIY